MWSRAHRFVVVAALAGWGCRAPEPVTPEALASAGIERRTIDVDGRSITYALIRPPDDVDHVLLMMPPGPATFDMVVSALEPWSHELAADGWAVVSPASPDGPFTAPSRVAFVPAFLDAAQRADRLPTGPVHLMGISFGGLGAFHLAQQAPERFCHVVGMPGMPADKDPARLEPFRGIPVSIVVGDKDRGWKRGATRAAAALQKAGVSVDLTVVPNQHHLVHRAYDWPALQSLLLNGPGGHQACDTDSPTRAATEADAGAP